MKAETWCKPSAGSLRFAALAVLALSSAGLFLAQGETLTKEAEAKFVTLYPGVYTEREKPLVEAFLAANKAIEDRGPVDVKALIAGTLPKDTPGIGPTLKITEALARYYGEKYDPGNSLRVDAAYARKAGYKDILVYPTIAAHDDSFMVPYPTKARDTLLVSDLIHSVTFYKPIYPGDTMYFVVDSRTMTDRTPPEGSIYRSVGIVNKGSIYNQKGEKVLDVTYTVQENIKIYKQGLAPANPTFGDMWEERNQKSSTGSKAAGSSSGPGGPGGSGGGSYKYTDDDWKLVRNLWAKEKIQGSTPLYWEDVKIGDEPALTLEGPLDKAPSVAVPFGMGLGGSKSEKLAIMDPAVFKTMVRCETDGIYRSANVDDYIPPVPKDATTGEFGSMGKVDAALNSGAGSGPGASAPAAAPKPGCVSGAGGGMMNFSRRDLVIRHITNWMGDKGWLYNIRWGGLYTEDMNRGTDVQKLPVNPETKEYSELVPEAVKTSTRAAVGVTGDSKFIVVHSYVYNKYVRDGEFYVDLAFWIEGLNGGAFGEGAVTVRLPSKNAQ